MIAVMLLYMLWRNLVHNLSQRSPKHYFPHSLTRFVSDHHFGCGRMFVVKKLRKNSRILFPDSSRKPCTKAAKFG